MRSSMFDGKNPFRDLWQLVVGIGESAGKVPSDLGSIAGQVESIGYERVK